MLKKKNRLTSNSSFKATYSKNKVASDEFFVVYYGDKKQDYNFDTKFGFVVSKKNDKRATVRNKIKRRLRESVFLYLKEKNLPYKSVIFISKDKSKDLDFSQTLKSVYKLLDKIANKII